MPTLYDALGGTDVMLRVAHHWHERVLADPVVSHAFDHGFRADHTERLAAYWVEVLGGPAAYTGPGLGDESHVVRLHTGNGEHDEMDRRAVRAFADALVDAGVPPALHDRLVRWFEQANQDVNHRYPSVDDVPDGLPMPLVGPTT
ncbi:oxidoreductase [Nocardioides rubriscoriae]|uniref:globin domain-containing protein n=1 Tax=Nocardioides rubriscoriae TaxID=642762 RepID=UPI0011DF4187|nr:oxidoreductase [Nocardioides rubriscoriae]